MCPLSLKTSDSTQILATGKAKLWALLVGVNQYQDESFPNLDYSAMDCRELGIALNEATAEFPCKQILIHHDFAAELPTLAAIDRQLQWIATTAKPQDTVLIYFSGHGVIEYRTYQAVLCLQDTRSDALLETGLRMQTVLQRLETCEARQQLVWLDACHSGSLMMRGARDVGERMMSDNPTVQLVQVLRNRAAQSRGFYALLSCDEGQRSWEFPELGHGVFTYYLIQGLRGEAADNDGVIEADALYRYVYRQTVQYIQQKNQQLRALNEEKRLRRESPLYPEYPPQTPKRIVEGVGELVLGMISPDAIGSQSPPSASVPTLSLPSHSTVEASPEPEPIESVLSDDLSDDMSAVAKTAMPPTVASSTTAPAPGTGDTTILYHHSTAAVTTAPISATSNRASNTTVDRTLISNRPWRPYIWIAGALMGAAVLLPIAWSWWRSNSMENAESHACNIKADYVQTGSNQRFDAQILLDNCEAGGSWQQVRVQTLTEHVGPVWAAAFTSDGNTLASGSGEVVEIWDLRTQTLVRTLVGHAKQIHAVDISPNGQTIVSSSGDQTVKIWNLATGKLLRTLEGHTSTVWSVNISPDGQTLATSSSDRTIKIWNLATGELLRTLEGHQDWVFAAVFSPDGQTLASASQDRTIKLWDWQNSRELQTLTGHNNAVRSIGFDPRGERLASASWDRSVRLWDLETGEVVHTFTGHTDHVVSLAFSPDGKTLTSGSRDRTVRLWNVETRTSMATLYGHTDWVLAVDFSPDGNTLVSGSRDQVITLWRR
ncbi:WD40 domain-containing protein [Thermocoleostomius sinensis]|uniref:Caspase family protein n=1 Tax=Thermocoleostomius sinensis A174 TaxID=2016057 RepID=A0A9E9C7D6_9CYAN|nr:caspase family protein [Thermocoleostomius sinensis]WAL60244.1 caspase family protein [Thermocoleostomius sinensis A174]